MNFSTSTLTLTLFVNTIRDTTKSILEVATWCSEAANIPAPSEKVNMVALPCTVLRGLEEKHMIRSLGSTVHMS